MEIKSAKQMVKNRDILLIKLEKEYNNLSKLSNFPLLDVEEKSKIYERINSIKSQLDYIERIMYSSTKFNTEVFVDFINKFFKLTNPEYRVTKLRIADPDVYYSESIFEKIKRKKAWANGQRINDIKGKWCYFICTELERQSIVENVFDDDDLDVFRKCKLFSDVIIMDTFDTYPFLKNFKMKRSFAHHKRLKTAIYELIDLKIKNPELTDDERFDIVLKNTVRRNINRSNNLAYQKKKSN